MEKKRVLFILHLPPPLHGASIMGNYIKNSQVINERFDCCFVNLGSSTDIENIGKFSIKKIQHYFRILHAVSKEIKRFKPDLVYITPNSSGLALYKDYFVLQLLKRHGLKVLAHFHNKGFKDLSGGYFMKKFLTSYFHGLKTILLSTHLYEDVESYVPPKDVYYCPNGIPDVATQTETKQNSPIRLLFLSNMFINKGVFVLLDALKILKEKDYSFTCDMVGDETSDLDRERIITECKRRGIDKQVSFHGKKEGTEKNDFYKNADIFLFPSLNECFSLVLLEAMQFGLPCISTDEGGLKDIIEDGVTGFLIPKHSPSSLAEKTAILIKDDNLRTKMGNRGRKRYEEKYQLPIFENRLCDIFLDMLSL